MELASASRSQHTHIMTIEERVPLAPLTTFGIGGPARFFVEVTSVEELQEAVRFAKEKGLKIFYLGGGSNVLIDDRGWDGLVVKINLKGVTEEDGVLKAAAGENWDALVEMSVQKGLWGIENLSGIPGSVGGAVVQNIGAYGSALSQVLFSVEVFDIEDGKIKEMHNEECSFGYRESIFKHESRYVILRAALRLATSPVPDLSYKDLAARFKDALPESPQIREAVLEIRARKFPDWRMTGTAGSFFKNPILPQEKAHDLQKKYPSLPLFPIPESTDIKVPLGWFLDYTHGVLDMRDVRVGGARMFEKQFLVLVAEKGTSSAEVKKLSEIVQKKVRDVLRIEIEPEVTFV